MTNKDLKKINKENGLKMTIVRGLPGSGKSSFAEYLAKVDNAVICCADDFFMKDGVYKWNPNQLNFAHSWCKKKAEQAMKDGKHVIIANTSTKESEFNPYVILANKFGYMTFSIIVENRHNNENIHDVPYKTIVKMDDRFQVKLR